MSKLPILGNLPLPGRRQTSRPFVDPFIERHVQAVPGFLRERAHAAMRRASPSKQEMPGVPIYLYLTEADWRHAWVNGGDVPIFPASKYRFDERRGVMTPDELRQVRLDGQPGDRIPPPSMVKFVNAVDCTISDCDFDGQYIENASVTAYSTPAHVLCFAKHFSTATAQRFEKEHGACVRILDLQAVIDAGNAAFGLDAEFGHVGYRTDDTRNHFEKSADDRWQDEYRLVWRCDREGHVFAKLPQNVAEEVWTAG